MKRSGAFSFTIIFFAILSNGQSITPFVVNSTGGFFANQAYMLDFSVGELAITTITNSKIITQGFLQNDLTKIGIDLTGKTNNHVIVFPNPASTFFQFQGLDPNESYKITVIDDCGREVFENISKGNTAIDMTNMSPGLYLVSLKRGSAQSTFKINKL